MATTALTTKTIQKYKVYIKATPQAIWDALTKAEWTEKYGYAPLVDYELKAGGKFRAYPNEGMKAFGTPDIIIDGEVLEANAPRKLAQTWRMVMDPEMGESESEGAGGGWSEILSGLKTLLETGSQLPFQSGPEKG
jgi:hypothetical protein